MNIDNNCVVIIRSPVDGRLFLAYPHDSGALSQSFDKLHLFDDGGSDLVSVINIFTCIKKKEDGEVNSYIYWCNNVSNLKVDIILLNCTKDLNLHSYSHKEAKFCHT